MARLMMKFEVQADLGVDTSLPSLAFKHPDGLYEVHLRNEEMTPGVEKPLMRAHVLFDDDGDMIEAASRGAACLERFLDFLALTTSSRFKTVAQLCICDWSAGITHRRGLVYRQFANPDFPQTVLNAETSESIRQLLTSDGHSEVMRALRWFRYAAAASGAEEKFELFWLSLEIIAPILKDTRLVPSTCPKCREPLRCDKCDAVPVHRPFPGQAVQQLFERFMPGGDGTDLFEEAVTLRHVLMHGGDASEKHGQTLGALVERVGRLARLVLLDTLARVARVPGTWHLHLIEPSTLLHSSVEFVVEMGIDCAAGEPSFDDFPPKSLEMKMLISEGNEGPAKHGPAT